LAAHNYHDAKKQLPQGAYVIQFKKEGGGTWNRDWFGGLVLLFPFIELNARADAIEGIVLAANQLDAGGNPVGDYQPLPWRGRTSNGVTTAWAQANMPVHGDIDAFHCPTNGEVRVNNPDASGRASYAMCNGDKVGRGSGTNAGPGDFDRRGPFGHRVVQDFGTIKDGTSNTIAYSEVVGGPNDNRVKGGRLATVDGPAMRLNPHSVCSVAAVVSAGERAFYRWSGTGGPGAGLTDQGRQARFADARAYMGFFNTINPPNSPSCASQQGDQDPSYGVWSATSHHPGGVNASMVDGSVRFITDSVNCVTSGVTFPINTPSAAPSESAVGRSTFGVWGAYGSIEGGESASL
jgi:prepilin-type processing-associated H-X9-DG protein